MIEIYPNAWKEPLKKPACPYLGYTGGHPLFIAATYILDAMLRPQSPIPKNLTPTQLLPQIYNTLLVPKAVGIKSYKLILLLPFLLFRTLCCSQDCIKAHLWVIHARRSCPIGRDTGRHRQRFQTQAHRVPVASRTWRTCP